MARSKAVIACILLAGILIVGGLTVSTSSSSYGCTAFAGQRVTSTPSSEWRQGEMPFLYQSDAQWASHPYATSEFAESGCGPTCLAMIYVFLTGSTQYSPVDIADMATTGGYASSDGTAWSFMADGARMLGIECAEIPFDEATVKSYLASGYPLIGIMGPGDFTSTGHFIVITGIDAQGDLIVRDPNSVQRSNRTWDFTTVQSQCRTAWAYWPVVTASGSGHTIPLSN